MNKVNSNKRDRRSLYLIILCWLVYTCSYIGKLSYNANINTIGEAFGVDNTALGTVSTFFFFTYGCGQVINGMLCKSYNIKYTIFVCLTVTGVINLSIPFITDFSIVKYLWLANGVAMSFLWTLLIRLLSEQLNDEYISKAIFAMGTTVATGTFLVYGVSSLFAAIASYKLTFFFASGMIFVSAFIWMISYNRLTVKTESSSSNNEAIQKIEKDRSGLKTVYVLIAILTFFAVANNFVKDGLTAWTPTILSDLYATPDWLSILLTLLLPALGICGVTIALFTYRRTKSFIGTCTCMFTVASVLIGAVIILLSTPLLPITVACFAIVSCVMASVNNVITSMVPLNLKEKVNSGKLAGILNGFCYLGSTLSTYTLGAVSETKAGWLGVFYLLLAISILVTVTGSIYLIFAEKRRA